MVGILGAKLKSLRFTIPVAERPMTILPPIPFCGGVGPSTSRVTLLVTPARVRSPTTCNLPLTRLTEVDLKVIVGYLATLKYLSDFKSVSRFTLFVLTVFVSIVASTLDLLGSFSSQTMVPVTPLMEPRTVLTPIWRILKLVWAWFLSMVQDELWANALTPVRSRADRAAVKMRRFIG